MEMGGQDLIRASMTPKGMVMLRNRGLRLSYAVNPECGKAVKVRYEVARGDSYNESCSWQGAANCTLLLYNLKTGQHINARFECSGAHTPLCIMRNRCAQAPLLY